MRIFINDQQVNIPSSLSEITLGQRIRFQEEHGDLLAEMAKSCAEIEDETERELESMQLVFERMFRCFSFFSGIPIEAIKESEQLDLIAEIYYATLKQVMEDEAQLTPEEEYIFKDEIWTIAPPELKHGDKMQFGELIDAKQAVKDMIELSKNKWEHLLPLCAVYFRKKDEAYDKAFLYEGSDRLELMKELPMDLALQVGFFLSSTVTIWSSFSRSSIPAG